jgi:spermidine/putrescine transport system ATP-binding protein
MTDTTSASVDTPAAMPPAGDAAVALEGVWKRFGDRVAVRDMNLTIRRGEFFSMLGPSGCGKTTTLRMIAGFEQPPEGRLLLEGAPVAEMPPYNRNVNTVFQSYALFEHLDVFKNVAFGLERRKVEKAEIKRRVGEALELVRLSGRERARPRELSGRMKQRVALARALVNRPAVLLLDEPLGALDLQLRKQMQVEPREIQREVGITFVYVTHDQEEALAVSDRIVINEGVIVPCGAPEEVYERPERPFVAGFIGISNLLDGVVEGDGVRLADGTLCAAPVPPSCVAGTPVRLSVRPEKVALDELIEDAMVVLRGIVVERVYLGTTTQVIVELAPGVRLVALEQNTYRARSDDRWELGTAVRLGWRPEHGLVLREG